MLTVTLNDLSESHPALPHVNKYQAASKLEKFLFPVSCPIIPRFIALRASLSLSLTQPLTDSPCSFHCRIRLCLCVFLLCCPVASKISTLFPLWSVGINTCLFSGFQGHTISPPPAALLLINMKRWLSGVRDRLTTKWIYLL